MSAPPISERHLHHFHRRSPIKETVRAATTANITISTALNNGDTLDGITLATDDRVLVKDQTAPAENGIYIVGASPARSYDVSTDDPAFGYLVLVLQGTTNAGTLWQNTNTSAPTIGSTSLTFSQFTSGGASFATPAIVLGSSAAAGAASTVIRSDSTIAAFDATSPTTQAFGDAAAVGSAAFAARRDHKHAWPTAAVTTSGLTQVTGKVLGRSSASTGAIEELTLGSGLSLSGGTLDTTGTGATITTKDEGGTLSATVNTLDFVGAGVTASGGGATTTVTIPGSTSTRTFGLDRVSFDATYGDDFDGASLNGRWSRHNQISGQETYQVGGLASILSVAHGSVNAAEYIYQTAPNNTNETWEASLSWMQLTTTSQMFGIIMVTTAGTGVGVMLYDNTPGIYIANVTSHVFASTGARISITNASSWWQAMGRVWLRMRKASGAYSCAYSFDGQAYSPEATFTPTAFTPTRIGVGRFLGTQAGSVANWHWFDKTA